MNDKELDVLLIEGVDNEGYTLKFTLRGNGPKELKGKLVDLKAEWMDDMKPSNKPQAQKYAQQATPQRQTVSSGDCKKNPEHGPLIIGRGGEPYCVKCYIEWKKGQKEY